MTELTTSVLATSPPADEQTRTLKCNSDFAVFDHNGDIRPIGLGEEGIYHRDARYLNHFILTIDDARPLLLGSTIESDGLLFIVNLTNPDLKRDGELSVPKNSIHIKRTTFLHDNACRSRITLRNFSRERVEVTVRLTFEADYVDIFEVRGASRDDRGKLEKPNVRSPAQVELQSTGLDQVMRRTLITFQPEPDQLNGDLAAFRIQLDPKQEQEIVILIQFDPDEDEPSAYDIALDSAHCAQSRENDAKVWASSERVNSWFRRSAADVNMMLTQTEHGLYPFAGLPWFNTIFGRDGIITALMYLWVNPAIARGVLAYLAAHQATVFDTQKDAEPGKILHEHREGEMAKLNEVPFCHYYGSVDATPLFVMLADAYFQRTGDRKFLTQIWSNVCAALQWIDRYGDPDGDGLVEYKRQSDDGIQSQGWKDSDDSISHRDGRLAEPPVALCEVQGYAYAARRGGARLARVLGDDAFAEQLNQAAEQLREKFESSFWCEDLGTYALALDRHKSPCRVVASNPGHCLFTGIASEDRAEKVVRTLFSKSSFSGWGVRTLSEGEQRYNPMSYHNGSVWPHDNAIIAAGLARYSYREEVLQLLEGLFGLSVVQDLHRVPELFCGFARHRDMPPTLYPVACSPQAWAAASAFFLLQATLGMEICAQNHELRFVDPVLPEWLPRLTIHNLRVNSTRLDLAFVRHRHDVGVQVLRCEGPPTRLIIRRDLKNTG